MTGRVHLVSLKGICSMNWMRKLCYFIDLLIGLLRLYRISFKKDYELSKLEGCKVLVKLPPTTLKVKEDAWSLISTQLLAVKLKKKGRSDYKRQKRMNN